MGGIFRGVCGGLGGWCGFSEGWCKGRAAGPAMRSIAEAGEARLPAAGGGGRPAARLPAYSSRSGKARFLLPRPAAFSHKSAKM